MRRRWFALERDLIDVFSHESICDPVRPQWSRMNACFEETYITTSCTGVKVHDTTCRLVASKVSQMAQCSGPPSQPAGCSPSALSQGARACEAGGPYNWRKRVRLTWLGIPASPTHLPILGYPSTHPQQQVPFTRPPCPPPVKPMPTTSLPDSPCIQTCTQGGFFCCLAGQSTKVRVTRDWVARVP